MVSYDANVDYQALINQAVAAGDYTLAAKYEQQRNAKIAATGSTYAQTNNYSQYLNSGSSGTTTAKNNSSSSSTASTVNKSGYATGNNTTGAQTAGNKSTAVTASNTGGTDYQALINKAVAAGNYSLAAQYEQQRNAKIDAQGLTGVSKTYNYQQYLNGSTGTTTGTVTKDTTNYQALINDAVAAGNYSLAAQYEQMRNQKIANEGLPYAQTNNWSAFLSGDSQASSVPAYDDTDYTSQIAELTSIIQELKATGEYTPVDQSEYMDNAMTYDEAYELARSIVAPQYKSTYDQTRETAGANLEKAGLYSTLYGQALAAQQENAVTDAMNSAIGSLALELQSMSYDQAYQLLTAAINENQYGTSLKQNALSSAASVTAQIIGVLQQEAANKNNYALQAASLQLQQQAQAIENAYMAGQITAQQLENQMKQLEIDAYKTANDYGVTSINQQVSSGNTSSGSTGSGGVSSNDIGGGGSVNGRSSAVTAYQNQLYNKLSNDIASGKYTTGSVARRIQASGLSDAQKSDLLAKMGY